MICLLVAPVLSSQPRLLIHRLSGGRSGPPDRPAPAERPPAEAPAARRTPQPAAHRATPGPILVVDDDPALLQAVRELLEDEGYPVVTATDGAAALQAIERHQPSLVLLDMRLPILTGWDVARVLAERGLRLPIVAMTAARDAATWAAEIGAAGYLAKPFDLPELLAIVERLRPRSAG